MVVVVQYYSIIVKELGTYDIDDTSDTNNVLPNESSSGSVMSPVFSAKAANSF